MGSFNGNGTFVRSFNWQQDAANAIDITASRCDTEDDGFATGLSACVTRDGQGKPTADFLPVADNTLNLGSASFRWASFNGVLASAVAPLSAVKTSTTSRSNTIVQTDDPDLVLPLTPGTWRIETMVFFSANAAGLTPGIILGLHFSGTCNVAEWMVTGAANGSSYAPFVQGFSGTNPTAVQSFAARTGQDPFFLVGTIPVTVAGNITLIWSQFNSSANASNVLANSFITARRLA